jgi:LPXTG-site transpeptidase (sortase) family protein
MKFHIILRVLAITLVVAGLIIVLPLSYYWLQSKIAVADNAGTVPLSNVRPWLMPSIITGQPIGISIPSLKINLQVIPGTYNPDTGTWTLTLNKAQFAVYSVQPNNESGDTFIYGHYRREVFAYLHLIKPGAQALITTSNNYIFSYSFQTTAALDPTDTSIFAYQGPPRLTVQTCSGSLFQHRQLYYFQYDGYTRSS